MQKILANKRSLFVLNFCCKNRLVSLAVVIIISEGSVPLWMGCRKPFHQFFSTYDVEAISHCKIKLLFRFTNRMEKDNGNNNKTTKEDSSIDERKLDTSKDIKKRMDKFEEKIKSQEAPVGDATRSDE